MAVAVWVRKAPPGRADSQADYSEANASDARKSRKSVGQRPVTGCKGLKADQA